MVGAAEVDGEFEAAAGGGVDAVGVAGFGEEALGAGEVGAVGEGGLERAMEAGGNGAEERDDAVVVEVEPLGHVEGAVEGLAQFLVGADDGVVHVEADVHGFECGDAVEADAAGFEFRGEGAVGAHDGVPVVAGDFAEEVEAAIEEGEPLGGHVVHHEVDDLVEGAAFAVLPAGPCGDALEGHAVVAPP